MGPALGRFKRALGLQGEEKEPVVVKKIDITKKVDPGFTRGIGLLIAAASLLGRVEAAEVEKAESTSEWWIIVLITAAIAILVDITFRVGTSGIQKWFKPREEIRVKLLSPEARLPTRGSDQAAGLDLYSTIETLVPPGESVLIKTGIAMELPAGTYGRIAPRSSLAIRGIETGAGVVDRDFRGEVKVLLRNWSDEDLRVYKGDRVAQLVVERILEVGVRPVEDLSETQRGNRGFGYSAHEEAYPWADPHDPLYQRQELGTRTPVSRISMRAMRVTPEQRQEVGIPPKRTAAKDTWLTLEDLPDGGKVSVREHVQERKKMFDFENPNMWGEKEWSPWRLTIAWAALPGKREKFIIVDERRGKRSAYLQETWACFNVTLPAGCTRKIICSTNVAETSVTVPDVDRHSNTPVLREQWCALDSLKQRRGRAGRVQPGVCLRLLPERHLERMDAISPPEMQRVPLENVYLQVCASGYDDRAAFLALTPDPPDKTSVEFAEAALRDLNALDSKQPDGLTPLGRHLAALPCHPRLGKILVLGCLLGVPSPCLSICAAMSVRNPMMTTQDCGIVESL
eukprot:g22394.t1